MYNHFSISVGIPTYLGGPSLVGVVNSIQKQTIYNKVHKIYIAVDGKKADLARLPKDPKISILYFTNHIGQSGRINDIFKFADEELLVLTNDDVILAHDALEKIESSYLKNNADLITSFVTPFKKDTYFQKIISVGTLLSEMIACTYPNSNHYLSCNGRLIALSKKFYQTNSVPMVVWNNDAYLFLLAKKQKRTITRSNATVYFNLPDNISEHINQSVKFQHSQSELDHYFPKNMINHYVISPKSIFHALSKVFLRFPLELTLYIGLFIFTRLVSCVRTHNQNKVGFWQTDLSTKGGKS